ncbi:CPBP family intramembrane metalloprotease [Lactobacillus sp. LC28-10]|uniref:CPBP family intramembrane metalloprotease n=1 Tax=Secundilactobacillus angelensis TaxID=2722706 RepID=A0ABX1L128_9LACO|nr:type II CAAX endopeptidase family protein [Secundilactobacillus angelensis]MCH5463237.1 CPBP family intramembrane metalloprotease [Secundilactobacillus angelensis]NLR19165.1 CPBP family intramembrane metalloprotease [Secundilactobacillus angelensis]
MQQLKQPTDPTKPSIFTRLLLFVTYFVAIEAVPVVLVGIRNAAQSQLLIRSALALVYLGGFVVIIFALMHSMKHVATRPFWQWPKLRDVRLILLTYVTAIVVELGLDLINRSVFHQSQTANNEAIKTLLSSDHWIFYLLMFSGVFLSPFAEELLFRGYLMNAFFKPDSFWLPIIVSAALFSLAHASTTIVSFLIYMALGLFLAYTYRRTKNLGVSIGLHMLNNLIAMIGMAVLIQ